MKTCRLLVLAFIAVSSAQAQTAPRTDIASEPLTEKQVFSGPDQQAAADAFRTTLLTRYGLTPVDSERTADADKIKRVLLCKHHERGELRRRRRVLPLRNRHGALS